MIRLTNIVGINCDVCYKEGPSSIEFDLNRWQTDINQSRLNNGEPTPYIADIMKSLVARAKKKGFMILDQPNAVVPANTDACSVWWYKHRSICRHCRDIIGAQSPRNTKTSKVKTISK